MISKEEWSDWKRHPVTQQVVRDLLDNREGRKEEMAQGRVTGNDLLIEIGITQGILDSVEYAIKRFAYTEIQDGTESSGVPSNSEG